VKKEAKGEEEGTFKEENEDLDMAGEKTITQLKRARARCLRSQGSDSACYQKFSSAIYRKRAKRATPSKKRTTFYIKVPKKKRKISFRPKW